MKVTKTIRVYDEAQQAWFEVFEAPGIEGVTVTAEVRRDEASSKRVFAELLKNGAALPGYKVCEDALANAIASDAPMVRRAGHNGWRFDVEGKAQFVSFCHVAGCGDEQVVEPPVFVMIAPDQIGIHGRLKEWKALVAAAEFSTAMMIALCVAFAAPLLTLLDRPSFGLMLYGASRSGKTSAQLVGASVIGYGREEDLPSLNATHAGLLAAGLMFNAHCLPLNEAGSASGSKREVGAELRRATYSLMNGRDVVRHPSWNGGSGPNSFKVLPVVSSELSPDEWAALEGEERHPGETVRMIGLNVVTAGSVFDFLPDEVPYENAAAWKAEQFRKLRTGLPLHRGVAFRRFTDKMVGDPDDVRARANGYVEEFERAMLSPEMSPIECDIVAKFALMAAGGALAVDWGILPFERSLVTEMVHGACVKAIKALPNADADLRKGLVKFRKIVLSAMVVDVGAGQSVGAEDDKRDLHKVLRKAVGFRRPCDGGEEIVLRAKIFADRFGTALALNRLLTRFDEEGFLMRQGSRASDGSPTAWARSQIYWPDRSRPRSFIIHLPRGLEDIDRML